MYKLNYLSICLILIAFYVFYNEFNKQLNIAEMALLAISFIAIIRASYNYIQLDNSNTIYEKFTSQSKRKLKDRKNKTNNDDDYADDDSDDDDDDNKYSTDSKTHIIMKSEDSDTYLDIEREDNANANTNTIEKITNINTNSKIVNDTAINSINNLLGINKSKDLFNDIPEANDNSNDNDEIKSVFMPKIVIGKSADGDGDGDSDGDNDSKCKTKNDRNSSKYKDKWNSVFNGNEFDVYSTNNNSKSVSNMLSYTDKKKCAKYYSRDTDLVKQADDGNFVVKEYKQARTWHPGYTYLPPSNWDVPQQYPPVCLSNPNVFQITGLVDRGLPLNVLELNSTGTVATTEENVHLTNVGSMLPKFKFEETPFSKPYI